MSIIGYTPCEVCHGTGKMPDGKKCEHCFGKGLIPVDLPDKPKKQA